MELFANYNFHNYNAIRLLHAVSTFSTRTKEYTPGEAIWGVDNAPEIVKVWGIDQKEEAQQELELYCCTDYYSYLGYHYHDVEEWALEICEIDEEGEWLAGSDYWLAPIASITKRYLSDAEDAMEVASEYAEDKDLVITGTPVFDDEKDAWCVTATDDGYPSRLEIRTDQDGCEEIEVFWTYKGTQNDD